MMVRQHFTIGTSVSICLLCALTGRVAGQNVQPAELKISTSATVNERVVDDKWIAPDEPAWFADNRRAADELERSRASLQQEVEVDLKGKPLHLVIQYLAELTGTPFYINAVELDLLGIDPQIPVTMKAKSTLQGVLYRMLDPLELTVQARQGAIEVTSKDAVNSDPVIEFYDARLVVAEKQAVQQLIVAIQVAVDPDSWLANGGTSSVSEVGPVLVIAAPESTQQKVRGLMANLARYR